MVGRCRRTNGARADRLLLPERDEGLGLYELVDAKHGAWFAFDQRPEPKLPLPFALRGLKIALSAREGERMSIDARWVAAEGR